MNDLLTLDQKIAETNAQLAAKSAELERLEQKRQQISNGDLTLPLDTRQRILSAAFDADKNPVEFVDDLLALYAFRGPEPSSVSEKPVSAGHAHDGIVEIVRKNGKRIRHDKLARHPMIRAHVFSLKGRQKHSKSFTERDYEKTLNGLVGQAIKFGKMIKTDKDYVVVG